MKVFKDWAARRAEARAEKALAARLTAIAADPTRTLRDEIEEWAAEGRDHPALIGRDGETLAFRDLYADANRWARWAIVEGIGKAEPVVFLFPPRPQRFAALVGLGAVGAVPAFVDPGLSPQAIAAAIGAIRPSRIVVEASLLPLFEAAVAHLALACTVWVHGDHPMAYRRLDEALAGLSAVRLTGRDRRALRHADPAVLVVLARPDGRPHVEHLDHGRVLMIAAELADLVGATRDDRLTVIETRPSLATLLAPTIALADVAACRLLPAAAEPDELGDPTLLHLDDLPATALVAAPRLLLVDVDDPTAPDRLAAIAPPGGLRRWGVRCEGPEVFLEVEGRRVPLPSDVPPPGI